MYIYICIHISYIHISSNCIISVQYCTYICIYIYIHSKCCKSISMYMYIHICIYIHCSLYIYIIIYMYSLQHPVSLLKLIATNNCSKRRPRNQSRKRCDFSKLLLHLLHLLHLHHLHLLHHHGIHHRVTASAATARTAGSAATASAAEHTPNLVENCGRMETCLSNFQPFAIEYGSFPKMIPKTTSFNPRMV